VLKPVTLLFLLVALLGWIQEHSFAANPASGNSPVLGAVGQIEGEFHWSAVLNDHVYLATEGSNALQVYDISTPATPMYQGNVLTDTTNLPLNTYAVHRGKLYLGYSSFIAEVDVSVPTAPVITRHFNLPFALYPGVLHMVPYGDYIYGSGETLRSGYQPYRFGIHLPTATVYTEEPFEQNGACRPAISGDTMLCGARVYSLATPPWWTFDYDLPPGLIASCGVYLDEPYLYTHDNTEDTTKLYQLGHPAGPMLLASLPALHDTATLVPWGDQLLRIGTFENPGADWLDISNPAAPVLNGTTLPLATAPCAEPPQVDGPYLYLNEGTAFRIYESNHAGYQTHLPLISRESCPPFHEDFSTRDNGWLEGGILVQEYGYTNDEYFMRLLAANFTAGVPIPLPCSAENLDTSVTGRWLEDAGVGFGVQFGPSISPTLYYDFQVNPDSGTYVVWERTPAGTTTFIAETPTPALEAGEPARLRVSVVNGVAILYVNDVALEEFVYLYEGPLQLRLSITTSATQATLPIEARFDDVRVYVP
jgi:hypothetical protein